MMDNDQLTAEQQRDVYYHGGLRETVTLAGRKIVLGELASKDRYKIFECFERDIQAAHDVYQSYVKGRSPGIFKALASLVRAFFGVRDKADPAVSIMRKYVEGLTENDIALIQVCAEGRNGMTPAQIRDTVLNSPPSEVQTAIRKALEINGIDVKKFLAARETAVPPAAASTTTSTAGSRE